MKILGAYGVIEMSPFEFSDQLTAINLSHTCVWRDGFRFSAVTVDGLCKEQPVWPVIFDSIRSLSKLEHALPNSRDRIVAFVTDARAALTNTNIPDSLWPENRALSLRQDLMRELKRCHKTDLDWTLKLKNPSIMDYVNTAVNPSILNDLQSAFYRISNYAARKEIQKLCISWLSGTTSWSKVDKALKSNIRYEKVYALMQSPLAAKLKDAVHQLKSGVDPADKVAKRTGFEPFELLYIVRSSASSDEKDKEAKAARK